MTTDVIGRMGFFAAMVETNTFTRSALAIAFCLLYRHLNGRTGRCNPSTATLADETGLTVRGVEKAIAELRSSGWWQIDPGRGRGRTNSYTPKLENPNVGSDFGVGKHEQPFGVLLPENPNGKVRKPEPQFRRTSKNRSHPIDAHVHAHRLSARSARARASGFESSAAGGVDRQSGELTHGASLAEGKKAYGAAAAEQFEVFWSIYPHRGEFSDPKKPARGKFEAAVKRGVDPAEIIAGAERYRAHVESQGTEPRYRPQAQTWLNQERWGDQLQAPEPARLRVGMN